METDRTSYRVTVEAEAPAAGRIARALDEAEDPQALSVSYFDMGNARFEVSALYAERPAEDVLSILIEHAAEGDAVTPLVIEDVPLADWVTVSQDQRGPVRRASSCMAATTAITSSAAASPSR
ncbi:MAG: hypothetical protein R3D30_08920 [Hyphomicrobiales bacterium]